MIGSGMHLFSLLTLIITCSSIGWAQCDSTLQAVSADSGYAVWHNDGDGNPDSTDLCSPDSWGPKFIFAYQADSSLTIWTFSEFLSNRRKLFLQDWCHGRTINYIDSSKTVYQEWTPLELNNRSITKPFPLSASDTLQFFRTLSWIDRLTQEVSFNRYLNSHALAYSVELVNATSGDRIALLDTFRISSTTSSKKPCIYSWYPMISRVTFVANSEQETTTVFIRIKVRAFGEGSLPFTRVDKYGKMSSPSKLTDSYWLRYADSVESNIQCTENNTCNLTVASLTSPSGLSISHAWPTDITGVSVYTLFGNVVWSSSVPFSTTPQVVYLNPGLYIIVGSTSTGTQCTRKVIVS